MGILEYWGMYFGFRAIAKQQHEIGVTLLDTINHAMTAQQRHDIEERLWDYSARLHLRLAEEFPEIGRDRVAKVATQLAVELLELDKLEQADPSAN